MSIPTCQICPKTVMDEPLYRYNETGVPGIWRCKKHMGGAAKPPDPETERIVNIIHEGNRHD